MATQQQIEAAKKLLWQQTDQQVIENQTNKQDKKIASQQEKMDSELTWDKAIDSVITTPQSQWSPYQIAVANLNPDLKSKNKRYQSAFNAKSVLENERVNLWQAWELMMNAYRDAIDSTERAAQWMMSANSINAALQAWAAISWSAWLSTNPAAAAQTRAAMQNQATAQNMQIRSNADQNIANVYNNMAQIPSTLTSISANNAQIDTNAQQAEANANLANAQAAYYNRQWTWSSWTYTKSTSKWGWDEEESEWSSIIDWIDVTKLSTETDNNWLTHYYLEDDKWIRNEINPPSQSVIDWYKVWQEYVSSQSK